MAAATSNLVNLEAVSIGYGTRTVLDEVRLGVGTGERIGVVGRNGGGKSTLLRMLSGRERPDAGRVTHTGGLRLGHLAQHDELEPTASVRAHVLRGRAEHEWAGDAGVREVLDALLGGVDLDATLGRLSGGERRRVSLARLLTREHDLLVLDEPTNHLDVEAIDWLAGHLASRPSALVVVSHDRWFLDATALTTWEVEGGRVHSYDGGYSAYVLARAERARLAATVENRRQNLLRKELAWLRRGPPARTSKPRFRMEAASALIANEPPARDSLELARFATVRLGRSVYDLEDVRVQVGEGSAARVLLTELTWRLGPGDRVGIVGVNGAGKTSLLRLLTGAARPAAGTVQVGRTVRAALLTQEVGELDPGWRLLEAVETVSRVASLQVERGPKGALGRAQGNRGPTAAPTATAGQLLERFGFAGERQWTPVGDLSGGERRRLQLLRLLMGEPNVLLLDEPTNDLDIETLTVLEDLLDSWVGSVVVVSHDRWFLERVTDTVYGLLGDGRLTHLPGGVEDYLARRRSAGAPVPEDGTTSRARPGDTRAARKELTRVERDLAALARREQRLHADLAASATDHERVLSLDGELRALLADKEQLEDRWLALAEQAG